MQQNSKLIEDLEKLHKTKGRYYATNNVLTLLAVCSVPVGVLAAQPVLSICGIVWITSGFFMFCSNKDLKDQEQIKLQIDLLKNISELEIAVNDAANQPHRVDFGPISLN